KKSTIARKTTLSVKPMISASSEHQFAVKQGPSSANYDQVELANPLNMNDPNTIQAIFDAYPSARAQAAMTPISPKIAVQQRDLRSTAMLPPDDIQPENHHLKPHLPNEIKMEFVDFKNVDNDLETYGGIPAGKLVEPFSHTPAITTSGPLVNPVPENSSDLSDQ